MALQLKVNELIAAQKGAHNSLIAIEELSDAEVRSLLHNRFIRLAAVSQGGAPTSIATVEDVKATVEEPAPRTQVIATTLGTA
jgi:low affinity Fe/Cu permease